MRGHEDPVVVTAIVNCDDPVAEPVVLMAVRWRLSSDGSVRLAPDEAVRLAHALIAAAGPYVSKPTEGGADGEG